MYFCHRWDKGIRYIPIPILKERIEELVEKFNVGFISFGDENFGSSHEWLKEFCEMIKPFDLLWRVGGMRVNRVNLDILKMMKDAGCTTVFFGMETVAIRCFKLWRKKLG